LTENQEKQEPAKKDGKTVDLSKHH
jgi:hypothetical protein